MTAAAKHSAEPWERDDLLTPNPRSVVARTTGHLPISGHFTGPHGPAEDAANAARIVACVNACAGLTPEAIPALVEACEESLRVQALPFDHPDKRDLPKVLRAALAAVRGSK